VRGIESADEIRTAGKTLATFSPAFAMEERRLKNFMYDKLYYHPEQLGTAEKARDVIARLYVAFEQDPTLLEGGWREKLPPQEPQRSRHIADYIAGMTDRFAIDQCKRIYGSAPEGLSNV
jgi:dGTPase